MNYLCLVYSDANELHSLPDSPKDAECAAYVQSLEKVDRTHGAGRQHRGSPGTHTRR